MSYGSGFASSQVISMENISLRDRPVKRSDWTGFLRIFIIIAEVGLSMLIPGSWGAWAVASQVGIGLAAASANTAISASTGNLSGINVGIDFGTAFIPGLTGAVSGIRTGKKIASTGAKQMQNALKQSVKKTGINSADNALTSGLNKARSLSMKAMRTRRKAIQMSEDLSKRLDTGTLTDIEKATIESIIKSTETQAFGTALRAQKMQANILKKWNVSLQQVEEQLLKWDNIFSQIKKIPLVKRMSRHSFLKEVEKLAPDKQKNMLKSLYNDLLRSGSTKKLNAKVLQAESTIRVVSNQLSDKGREYFNIFVNKWKYIPTTAGQISKETNGLIKLLSTSDLNILRNTLSNGMSQSGDLAQTFHVLAKGGMFGNAFEKGTWRGWIKGLGSRRFNEKFVQRAQWIDPNDVGRAPIEATYKFLKKRIERKLYDRYYKKSVEEARKNIFKQSSKKTLNKAFKAAGGKIIRGQARPNGFVPMISRYISGIKKLPGIGTPLKRSVLVMFNKANATALYKGKNLGGKHDMLVTMSDLDFDRLAVEGTSYWFAVGQKKGWFLSRGGKRLTGRNSRVLANNLSLFLGFVPIPALRNVLSIVSNWVENVSDLAKGTYADKWFPSFQRAFVRSTINRSARLLTRVVIGGAVKGIKVRSAVKSLQESGKLTNKNFSSLISAAVQNAGRKSAWIGRELQRASITTLSTFQGKDKDGYFAWRRGARKGESVWKTLGMKFAKVAVPTSVRSGIVRAERRRGGTPYGRQLINAKRYTGYIFRGYSAFTPSGPGIPTLRKITKIK